jgi:NAD(P)-dependent dehydrogenase (short-subunit alcohol dehydrogenase family)
MKSFRGKVAAITGAGSGIGRALALQLAAEGCHLALSDVNEAGLAQTAAFASKAAGIKIVTSRVDVSSRAAVFDWAAQAAADHGRVNLLVNNAGVDLGATAERTTLEELEWLMGINFWGTVHGTQAFLPHLRASGEGHVVNVSSVFGLVSVPGQSAYNASKFAVRGYTECLRQELELTDAPVSATCVHPGGIKTNIARAARVSQSLEALGDAMQPAQVPLAFESALFRTTADEAAAAILRGVRRNARRVLIGGDARAIDLVQRLFPAGYQRLATALARRFFQRRRS